MYNECLSQIHGNSHFVIQTKAKPGYDKHGYHEIMPIVSKLSLLIRFTNIYKTRISLT